MTRPLQPKTQPRPLKALPMARWKQPKALPTRALLPLAKPAPLPAPQAMPPLLVTLPRLLTRRPKLLALPRKLPTPQRALWKKPRSKLLFGFSAKTKGGRRFTGGPFFLPGRVSSSAVAKDLIPR